MTDSGKSVVAQRTRLKICGLTRRTDIDAAIAAGADAIGFVLWEGSRRAVTAEQLARLTNRLPPFVSRVGLFVNASAQQVEQCLPWLDVLQFHGDESPLDCATFGVPWFKALRMKQGLDLAEQVERYAQANALLLDAWVPDMPGGTGQRFDWQRIPAALAPSIILAGGLTADNVGAAIHQVGPYAVDVSGGVESGPGTKSVAAMQAFANAVRQADATRLPA
ncbi:phosphoribosylanthranilate isomerase [Zymobacter palmae]|uniref:N-(5'-phosphoribosyl)anthranilate isomerase n=1 Tax=Zymobacter palmae TaxID=33074 RepID=A0A348HE47_9GAMM|nr:phosphoribosylanthranilate isomerase [Zymobacter palmae]BBG29899.1 phospho ribosylanthranilate isomerase [Zymobacter palmae]